MYIVTIIAATQADVNQATEQQTGSGSNAATKGRQCAVKGALRGMT